MEERLLNLLESVLGKSKRTSGDNYAFYSPFVEHYKPKLEINIKLNSDGNNPWHCWISDEKGKSIKSLLRKLKVSKDVWDEHNAIFNRRYRYVSNSNDVKNDVAFFPSKSVNAMRHEVAPVKGLLPRYEKSPFAIGKEGIPLILYLNVSTIS